MQRPIETPPLLAAANPAEDAERARAYLSNIPSSLADDYDDWLKVGMALHSVGDDSLLADWCQWSAASGKFKAGECEAKWASFKSDSGGVGLGTLYHLAGGPSIKPAVKALNSALGYDVTPTGAKPQRFESGELLAHYRAYLGDRLRFNIYNQAVEIDAKPVTDLEHYYLQLAQQNIKVSKELAADALVFVAKENQYDPVREYLDRVADDVPPASIDHLSTSYLRPGDQPGTLFDAMLRCTLIAAVRRVFEPGAKHDAACVLMGPQGCGKSTFWRNLGGPFFSDALGDINSKDDLLLLGKAWIHEWGEIDRITGKRHAGQVKAFLSQQTDCYRVPYGKAVESFPRRSIIVGSTNRDTGFLIDDTGNRRFWVVPVDVQGMIEVDGLLLERDAIWSAAVAAYRNGEPNHLPSNLEREVAEANLAYLVESPWLQPVRDWLASPRNAGIPVTTEVLLTDAIGKPLERQSRADQMQIASILREIGLIKRRRLVGGTQKWVYCQPSA